MALIYRNVEYDGIRIGATSITVKTGAQNVEYIYPDSGTREVQLLADYPDEISITGYLYGNSIKYARDKLLYNSRTNKKANLVLGSLGVRLVQIIGTYEITEDLNNIGNYTLGIKFGKVEEKKINFLPTFLTKNVGILIDNFVSYPFDVANDVLGFIDSFNFISQAFYFQERFESLFLNLALTLDGASKDIQSLSTLGNSFIKNINDFKSLDFTLAYYKAILNEIESVDDDRTKETVYKGLIENKSDFSFKDSQFTLSEGSVSEVFAIANNIPLNDPLNIETIDNFNKYTEIESQIFFASYLKTLIDKEYILKSEINEDIDFILKTFLQYKETVELTSIVSDTISNLKNKLSSAYDISEINIANRMPYSVLAISLYNDDSFSDILYKINKKSNFYGASGKVKILVK